MRLIIEESFPGECRESTPSELSDKLEKAVDEARRIVVSDSPLAGDGEVRALTAFKDEYGAMLDGHLDDIRTLILKELRG